MSVYIRTADSPEMKKNIKTVKMMTKGMGFDEKMGNVNWSVVRRISNFGYKFMPKEKGVKFTKLLLNSSRAEMAIPKELSRENIIIYIHGGGFVSGSAESSRGYCSMLAKYSKSKVIALNYSPAPEYAFPKAIDDCFNAYCEICKLYPDSTFSLVGESAGANLCLSLTHKIIDEGVRKPSCLITHSPIVDFTGSLDRSVRDIEDFTVKVGCLKPLNRIYVGESDSKNPYISPIFGEFSEFPPVFITCDYNETLFADSLALYDKCIESNIETKLVQMKNTFHAFATIGTGTPETKTILEENIAFIEKHTN